MLAFPFALIAFQLMSKGSGNLFIHGNLKNIEYLMFDNVFYKYFFYFKLNFVDIFILFLYVDIKNNF